MSAKKSGRQPKELWFGHPGHFICAKDCRFHMATLVGPWLVSTVGALWPSRLSREIHASVYDPKWLSANGHLQGDEFDAAYMDRFGYETIGCDRTYETMVFEAGKPCTSKTCGCGLPSINGDDLDFAGYNNAGAATRGHRQMVKKWSTRKVPLKEKP